MPEPTPAGPSAESAAPETAPGQELVRALLDDQCQRWQQGECVPVESYLERHPALRTNVGGLLDLIYQEVVLRAERGETPQLADYLQRFPQLAPHLA